MLGEQREHRSDAGIQCSSIKPVQGNIVTTNKNVIRMLMMSVSVSGMLSIT